VPPRRAPGLIHRERLLGLVDQVQAKALTVVRAAAGFGKTSLAAAWAEHLHRAGHCVAWLSLDADDDEPTRFLFHVAHVLRRSCSGLGEPAVHPLVSLAERAVVVGQVDPVVEQRPERAVGVAVIGILIICAGAILLGGNLGLIDSNYVFRNFGPIVLFIIGAALLARRRHDQVLMGLVLMVVGAWGFATQQQWVKIHFWAVVGPMMLVLAGGSVVWRAFNRPAPEGVGDAYIRTFAIFSGAELRPSVPFEGADLTAVMGGVKLSL